MIEPLDTAPIRAREQAASPAPWELVGTSTLYMDGRAGWGIRVDGKLGQQIQLTAFRDDAEFIAAARRDVRALLDTVDALRHINTNLTATIRAFPDANDAANLAHARAERDALRVENKELRAEAETLRDRAKTGDLLALRYQLAEIAIAEVLPVPTGRGVADDIRAFALRAAQEITNQAIELDRLRTELAEITDQRDQLHDRGRQIERAIAAAETQRNNALAAVDNITNTLAKVRASLTEQAATYESAVEFLGGEIDRLTAELASRPRALPDGVVVTEYTVPLPPGASIPFRGDVIYVRADGLGRWRIANGADTLSVPWLTAAGEWSYDRSADARWTDLDAALTAAQAAAHEITVGGRTAGQVLAEEQDRGRSE